MANAHDASSMLSELERRLGTEWKAIRKAQSESTGLQARLESRFAGETSPDTSIVVFGSVARREVTSGSDLDWVLLLDGQAVPEHKDQERKIAHVLTEEKLLSPGQSGVFGKMVGSHDLVHNIGGEDDLNSNTTRRVLLLLESCAVGNAEAYDRVRRQIIRRYLHDDLGLTHAGAETRIPRFLLNDLTRYWRTVTVDFVYKQRGAGDAKWALRNAKLRMSRKLLFAAGLLHVFSCHLSRAAEQARTQLREARDVSLLASYLHDRLTLPPLEAVATACVERSLSPGTVRAVFDNYDRFLRFLDDPDKRLALSTAALTGSFRESPVWTEVRELSRPFHDGLVNLFLKEDSQLSELTMTYGLF